MQIELRADGAHISGYVNVTEKKSRPVVTPRGRVIEEIEPRAFEAALKRAGDIGVTVDHDRRRIYASTKEGTAVLREDGIGLHADVRITDRALIETARAGKIKGWSFGMYNIQDEVQERAGELPLRRIRALDLDHLALVVNRVPVYSATSVELRADSEVEIEERTLADAPVVQDAPGAASAPYRARLAALQR